VQFLVLAAFCVRSVEPVEDGGGLEQFVIYRAEKGKCNVIDRMT
jgi:hypothetical protein